MKRDQILKAGHFFTAADFVDQQEADVEDFFDAQIFADILNAAYKPPAEKLLSKEVFEGVTETHRLVKKAEALFRLMPPEVPEFDHFTPARWLLENPQLLDDDSAEVSTTLDRAESVFKTFNALLA